MSYEAVYAMITNPDLASEITIAKSFDKKPTKTYGGVFVKGTPSGTLLIFISLEMKLIKVLIKDEIFITTSKPFIKRNENDLVNEIKEAIG